MICLIEATGQDIPANDARLMDNFITSMLTFKKERLSSEDLGKIFTGSFYTVVPTYSHDDGATSSCEKYEVVIKDGKLSKVEDLSEDKSMTTLFSLLKPGITIKDEGEAKTFEAALDVIYPTDWTVDESDKKALMKDGKWLFLRGDFFGSKKGFIVTIDQNKRITQIDYSLKAIGEQQ
jgi:hypothetical protein